MKLFFWSKIFFSDFMYAELPLKRSCADHLNPLLTCIGIPLKKFLYTRCYSTVTIDILNASYREEMFC